MRFVYLGAITLVGAIGCVGGEDQPANPTDVAIGADAAVGDGEVPVGDSGVFDVGVDAVAPMFTCDLEPCAIQWASGPDSPLPVDHHTTAVIYFDGAPSLVVFGGLLTENANIVDMYTEVMLAPIQADGTLGEWQAELNLGMPMSFHAQTTMSDRTVVILGGISQNDEGLFALAGVTFLRGAADGSFDLTPGSSLPSPFRHSTAEAIGDRLFVMGGMGSSGPQATVLTSVVDAELGHQEWEEAAPLPEPRTHHASVAYEGRLYIVGGYGLDAAPTTDILRSVHEDGSLTGWEVIGSWDSPRWTSSAFVRGEHLYLVGGGVGQNAFASNLPSLLRAQFIDEGLTEWEEVQGELPMGRSHVHQTPVLNDVIYSVGGRAGPSFSSTSAVHIGRFGPLE